MQSNKEGVVVSRQREQGYFQNPHVQEFRVADHIRREYSDFVSEMGDMHAERPPLVNAELPAAAYRDEIIAAIQENQVVIIQGETGSGKSTQVPKFAFDAGYDSVIQTQPRRVAARTVAERIEEEVHRAWTGAGCGFSAYHTAEKNTATNATHIRNVTDGLLLAQESGPNGREVSVPEVVIVDEVHEWSMNIEMMLAWILRQLQQYPDRRFVIQSATVDTEQLQYYFASALGGELPPVISIEGRTFPVEMNEHPEREVVEFVVERAKAMHQRMLEQRDMPIEDRLPTALLVPSPGTREIKDWINEIRAGLPKDIAETATILPLHSKMSDAAQNMALRTDYPGLKIVAATNVAKTSLTIPDIAEVIDSGYARQEELDKDFSDRIVLTPTARADRVQWAGRAGRVAPGVYHLVKMPDMPFISMDEAAPFGVPEAQRTNPVQHVLREATKGVEFSEIKTVHKINEEVIEYAKESLRLLGALDENNVVTAVGRRMSKYPLQPAHARMVVQADRYSPQVRSYVAAIASAQGVGGLPSFINDNGRRWKTLLEQEESDLLAQLDIFIKMQGKNRSADVKEYDLDEKNLNKARETYWKVVRLSDGYKGELEPPNQDEIEQIKRCIYAGMPDGLYAYAGESKYRGIDTRENRLREISNRSVVRGKNEYVVGVPREIEKYVKGVRVPRDIIEFTTVANPKIYLEELSLSALSRVTRRPIGDTRWMNGRPHVQTEIYLGDAATGVTELVPAGATHETRQFMIDEALKNPGAAQRSVREVKKQLEQLQHLTNRPVPQLTQEAFEQMLHDAAPIGLADLSMIDVNLSLREVSIRDYISEKEEIEIRQSSPEHVDTVAGKMPVRYRNGRPIADSSLMLELLAHHDGDVTLADGRAVYFVVRDEAHDNKRREYTLQQLRNKK